MSRSHRSIDFDDKMMHHIFDMDSGYKPTNSSTQQRKSRMKRMEELSHSLDDGLNNLPDDQYARQQAGNGNHRRQMEPQYNDEEDDDEFLEEEYIDEYYYNNNNTKSFDGRPRSYNEKYASYNMYDDYRDESGSGGNFHRNRYSLNESSTMSKPRYPQQSPVAQQKQSTLRRPTSGASSGNGSGSQKHILFNEDEEVHYMNEKKLSKTASTSSSKGKLLKKEPKSPKESSSSSLFSSKKKASKEDLAKPDKSPQQVMNVKLKIQNAPRDDFALHTRPSPKQNMLHRHHSVEAKLPSHGDRSNMSPTIMEEIEFEMQDFEADTDKEVEKDSEKEVPVEKVKEKSSKKDKEKEKEKEKKGDSAPSTPTTKKSFKAHLSNHKKLFKVPDIDLNHFSKFSCFFSSNKNIAALKASKKEDTTSKSAEALNESSPKSSPKSSPTTKSPPSSPKKLLKGETKVEKIEKIEEKFEKSSSSRTANSKTTGSGSTIQSSSEGIRDEDVSGSGGSDVEFEVNFGEEK